jgi:predicted helicase
MASPTQALNDYISALNAKFSAGNATEHSYRPALQTLLEILSDAKANHIQVTNEPKRIDCGAPDYSVTKNELPLGHLEAKNIPVNLADRSLQSQFDRYKKALNNLIITNYLTFELYRDSNLVTKATIGKVKDDAIVPDKTQYDAFLEIITSFIGYEGKTITSSDVLAELMADKAKLLAETMEKALKKDEKEYIANESKRESMTSLLRLLQNFRIVLIHNLSIHEFADMYAQTLCYGMFAAWLNYKSTQEFDRFQAALNIPKSNPFLDKFFDEIGGKNLDLRLDWIISDLAVVFNAVSKEDILKEFGKIEQDPYIHFYETFLASYNPELRKARGVWYTPYPIVKFMVDWVDRLLIRIFKINGGLANEKVNILDPATGTGTFLAEIVSKVFEDYKNQSGLWQEYCDKKLIPRLNGFEILMAPYTMAHLKLDMKLRETGFEWKPNESGEYPRLNIFLTNSLEKPIDHQGEFNIFNYLSAESENAAKVKNDTPLMVIIGNPPYNVSTQNSNDWINTLLDDYKKSLNERNIQPLSDDYIKFIRYGQYLIEKNGYGIMAFISNNTFLDGLIHRKMRESLIKTFDMILIANLHGSAKKRETVRDGTKDENVFDIQQGVSINFFIKKQTPPEKKEFYCRDIFGPRDYKYEILYENQIIGWGPGDVVEPEEPNYFLNSGHPSRSQKYERFAKITDIFPVHSNGIKTQKDDASIALTKKECQQIIDDFNEYDYLEIRNKYGFKDVRDWTIQRAKEDIEKNSPEILPIEYRPFDSRYCIYTGTTKGIMGYPRDNIMKHLIGHNNVALLTVRQQSTFSFHHAFVTNTISQMCSLSNQTSENSYVFPLYIYPEYGGLGLEDSQIPNINLEIAEAFDRRINPEYKMDYYKRLEFVSKEFAEDIFNYIYAVLYSNHYRETYAEFLKIDFPRVPYPENADQFKKLAALGSSLCQLHLLENVHPSATYAGWPVKGSNLIEQSEYKAGSVNINKDQYFANVPETVWTYQIGGYQPAQKWLKDRKGRTLDIDTIEHYQKIITALALTIDLQEQIDEVVKTIKI